ncbi:hypothetical protein [Agromyces humatus]|uniref:DUF998 domain-containing protein n=1 Tax=Agromyces humatus TaxID=279573 RepID=A0ABN2KF84_9MICO|nr:hypothetical protein [Agromyces humatus]
MREHPSRPWAVATALIAAAWAFFLLPPQQAVWSGADIPPWLGALDSQPVYDGIRLWLASMGLHDYYLVFGAAASVSFLLLWFATGPALIALGWSGRVLSLLLLVAAPLTLLSYLNHPTDAPLHLLWGAEGVALLAICLWAMVVALAAPRDVARVWERLLLAATLPIVVGATILFTYWPHGSLIGLGIEAAVLAAWAPRADVELRDATATPDGVRRAAGGP